MAYWSGNSVVPTDQTIELYVGDSLYADNSGGVSVRIDSVPIVAGVPDATETAWRFSSWDFSVWLGFVDVKTSGRSRKFLLRF